MFNCQSAPRRVLTLLSLTGLLAGCSPSASTADRQSGAAAPAVAAAQSASAAPLVSGLPDFSALVEAVGPAVVNIQVEQKQQQVQMPGMSPDDPFYEFFRRFGVPRQGPRSDAPPMRGMGSGFIISSDGYILTNAHVVDDADEVTVKLTDRREFTAKLVGVDKQTDVAVVKIEAKGLPVVRLGDATKLKPGEWVVAIGSPFGFENSVTAGVVSGLSRSVPGNDSNYTPFIQTDVAVNPGNSGGPLFNLRGEVVGINSQIYSRSGGYMGVSFAIPIDIANDVRKQLVATGHVRRGRIGVYIQGIDAQLAESFGLDRPRGALVTQVEEDGPADKAGVKAGDVIVGVAGQPVEDSASVPVMVARLAPGENATFGVWRDRKEREIKIRIGESKESAAVLTRAEGPAAGETRIGIAVRELDSQEQGQIETDGSVVVTDVSGAALRAGIREGDVVLAVNSRPVKSVAELKTAIDKSGKTVALLIQRDKSQLFVPVRVE
ncbi:MAG: DegQ family serine endoprotease [Steroidobacteraceae bacterium]